MSERRIVRKATMADAFHPTHLPTPYVLNAQSVGESITQSSGARRNINNGLCGCGMARTNDPHLCIQWHPNLMTEDGQRDLSAAVRKHVDTESDQRPIVRVNELAGASQAYLRKLLAVREGDVLVRWTQDALEDLVLRNDRGQRITVQIGEPDAFGVVDLTLTQHDDPVWEREFVRKHSIERSTTSMPTCCDRPDPRLAKSGRPFCANCKRYLDKVPKPVEGPQTPVVTQ